MDLKGLVDKAKGALRSNPDLIEKGGDAIDKATGNKYADKVDKAQDAARKAVGAPEKNQNNDESNKGDANKGESNQGGAK